MASLGGARKSIEVLIKGDASSLNRSLAAAALGAKAFRKELETGNDRMHFLVQTSLALGPALIPTFAALTPAIAGFSSALGFSVLGAGTAVLAFQGVGDALKAMNDYAIDPTAAHLKALNEAMDTLGPAGQDFVVFLQGLRPEMQRLQDLAQEGLFPGLEEGIQDALTQLPLVEDIVTRVSTALGDMAASAGQALTNPFWTDFFEFLKADAQQTLTDFGSALGHIFEGLAALTMDFAPLSRDFVSGFDDMARAFSAWAQNLPNTQGFQDFLAYLREAGPVVVSTLESLGDAFVELVEAASGVGISSLRVIGTLADIIANIADSPIGPVLIGFAAGLAAVSRAFALFKLVGGGATTAFLNEAFAVFTGVKGAQLITRGRTIAAAISLIALSFTDLDEKLGLSNTAAFAAIGGVFGPWGAALGAAAGAARDAAAANNDLTDSLDRVDQVMENQPENFSAQVDALRDARAELDKFRESVTLVGGLSSPGAALGRGKNLIEGLFGKSDVEESNDRLQEQLDKFQQNAKAVSTLARALGDASAPTGDFRHNIDALQTSAENLLPALEHMGVTIQDLGNLQEAMSHGGVAGGAARLVWQDLIDGAERFNAQADSVRTRSNAVAEAIAGVGDASGTAAQDTIALQEALDNLLDPTLDAEEAMDTFKEQIQSLSEELKAAAGFSGFSAGAIENRSLTRDVVTDLKQVLVTQVAAKKSSQELAQTVVQARREFIAEGIAAGFSRREITQRANAIGLTPRLVRTVFEGLGISKVEQDATALEKRYNSIPKNIRTKVEADGVQANDTVDSLMKKYDGLSRADATTIIKARDSASPILARIRALLDSLDGRTAHTYVLNEIRTQTINTVLDRHLTRNEADGGVITYQYANGGVNSIGGMTPKIATSRQNGIMWAEQGAGPWEAFISGHPLKRDRSRSIADDVVDRLGGTIEWFAGGGTRGVGPRSSLDLARRGTRLDLAFIDQLADALHRVREESRDVERAEDNLHRSRRRAREQAKDLADAEKRLEKLQDKEKVDRKAVYAARQDLIRQRSQSRDADKNLAASEKELTKQRDQLSKATDLWKQKQQELISQAQAISGAVTAQGDIFGGQGTSVSVGGILAKLRQSNKNAARFRRDIGRLRGMGLDERVLQQLLEQGPTPEGIAAAHNLAEASRREIKQINAQERRLVGVAGQIGALGIRHGNTTTVNFNIREVHGMDAKAMGREWPRQMRQALRIARNA